MQNANQFTEGERTRGMKDAFDCKLVTENSKLELGKNPKPSTWNSSLETRDGLPRGGVQNETSKQHGCSQPQR